MKNIEEETMRFFLKKVLLAALENGETPTAGYILEELKKVRERIKVGKPLIESTPHYIEHKSASSISQQKMITGAILDDIGILLQTVAGLEEQDEYTEQILSRVANLKRRTGSLIDRMSGLLAESPLSAGYLRTFTENFANQEMIDLTSTTARVDSNIQGVLLPSSISSPRPAVDYSKIRVEDISASVLTSGGLPSPGTRDSRTTDIFTDRQKPWMYTVSVARQGKVSILVKIDLSKGFQNGKVPLVSQLYIEPLISGGGVVLRPQYSLDGESWFDFTNTGARIAQGPEIFIFAPTQIKYIRIYLETNSHSRIAQTGRYLYDFGIRTLRIEELVGAYDQEKTFLSKPWTALSTKGKPSLLSKVILSKACEEIPEGTEINYFMSFTDQDGEALGFQRVVPSTKEIPQRLSLIRADSETSATTTQISLDLDSFIGFGERGNFLLANAPTTLSPTVYRNVGDKIRYKKIKQDSIYVEDGWFYINKKYITFAKVEEESGVEIDFGPSPITINGQSRTGKVKLYQGIHKFEVLERNYFSLKGLYDVSSFNPTTSEFTGKQRRYGETGLEEDIEIIANYTISDPLYPYNHKILIEGLLFASSFTEYNIINQYKGLSFYAGSLMSQIPSTQLKQLPSTELSKFGIETIYEDEEAVNYILVKKTGAPDEDLREDFVIEETSKEAYGVILKAVLKTDNPQLSPVLSGYEIKVIK